MINAFTENAGVIDNLAIFSGLPLPDGWTEQTIGEQIGWIDGGGGVFAAPVVPPPPVLSTTEQAANDLRSAGVTNTTITAANYADGRGFPAPLAAIDSAVDIVVISSGLTLAQVSELIV